MTETFAANMGGGGAGGRDFTDAGANTTLLVGRGCGDAQTKGVTAAESAMWRPTDATAHATRPQFEVENESRGRERRCEPGGAPCGDAQSTLELRQTGLDE